MAAPHQWTAHPESTTQDSYIYCSNLVALSRTTCNGIRLNRDATLSANKLSHSLTSLNGSGQTTCIQHTGQQGISQRQISENPIQLFASLVASCTGDSESTLTYRPQKLLMDIFGTVITSANLIITYIDATADYPAEARSLYISLKWDIQGIKAVAEYLGKLEQTAGPVPSEAIASLLRETGDYLPTLMDKATVSFSKLQAVGWRRALNQSLYFWRRNDLQRLQKEMTEWRNRFGVRLLGLPPEVRTMIPAAVPADGVVSTRPVLQSNERLLQFTALASEAKKERADDLRHNFLPKDYTIKESSNPDAVEIESQQFILTSRTLPPEYTTGTDQFERLASDLGELAAALHCLDADLGIGLLKVESYFYHASTRRFVFMHASPYQVGKMMTLENMIETAPYSYQIGSQDTDDHLPLDKRLRLSKQLAEAVFFLHTAGFLHKNITSTSIAALHRPSDRPFPASMGEPYLMGLDMVRSTDGVTVFEGAFDPSGTSHETIGMRNLRVFQHPDRHRGKDTKRYIKTYDVYSLGVVLLQIGLWEPISTLTRTLGTDSAAWPQQLGRISQHLSLRMGGRYQRVVSWCLGLKGNYIVTGAEFVREVFDPLEDMSNTLA